MRVKPIFKYSLLAARSALPAGAYALGLGRLTVESFVGQPLVARIELLVRDQGRARLACPPRSPTRLSTARTTSRTRACSPARASRSSAAPTTRPSCASRPAHPVSEPYLDLLVEVNWSRRPRRARLHVPARSAGVAAGDRSIRSRRCARALRACATRAAGRAALRRLRRARCGARRAAPASAPRGEGGSYEVKRGDTLSKIAGIQARDGDARPDAGRAVQEQRERVRGQQHEPLAHGRDHHDPERGRSAPRARRAKRRANVQVQASDWRAYRDRVAGAAPTAEESHDAHGGRTHRHRVTGNARRPRVPGSDQLRVSKDAGTGRGTAAAETSAAQAAALRDAQSRIAELEKTVKDMQRAIELRNPTMAQLADAGGGQGQGARRPCRRRPHRSRPRRHAATTDAAAQGRRAAEGRRRSRPSRRRWSRRRPPSRRRRRARAAKVAEPPNAGDDRAAQGRRAAEARRDGAAEGRRAAEGRDAATPKPAAKAPAKEPPGFFDEFLSSTPGWASSAASCVLDRRRIVALFAARRRKTTKFEDSIISGTDIKTNTVFGSTGGGVVNTGDNSLASDFSREGLGNIDTDEVDPIAEAEVYLAYGRDAQAEEILKDALKKDPQRQEIYLKLLEIHAQHNKPSAFETVASELYAVNNGQGEVWQKAVALGRQLDPANPMFADGGAPAARAGARAVAPEVGRGRQRRDPHRATSGLEFQMDEEISISPTSGAKPKSTVEAITPREAEHGQDRAPDRAATSIPTARWRCRRTRRRRRGHAARAVRHRCIREGRSRARPRSRRRSSTSTSSSTTSRSRRRWQKPREPVLETATAAAAPVGCRARAARASCRGARARQARPLVRSRALHVRGSDAVGARRAVARRRDQARPRQGVSGNGRRRRRARDPAGSAARGRRPAEGRGEVAAHEARLDPAGSGRQESGDQKATVAADAGGLAVSDP